MLSQTIILPPKAMPAPPPAHGAQRLAAPAPPPTRARPRAPTGPRATVSLEAALPAYYHLDNCLNVRCSLAIDETIRALGDPTRREILRVLRAGDLTAGDIAARFPITAASVSHHLSVLKEAGLVQAERDGRTIVYSLESTVFQEFLNQMMTLLDAGEDTSNGGGVT